MFRRFCSVLTLGLMIAGATVSADGGRARESASRSTSSGKRVMWTVIGAAAGFGAGVFLGLNAFDDAVNSDRKVWTTAIVGAAAGGVAGGLLSRNVGRTPDVTGAARKPRTPTVSWDAALGKSAPPSRGAGLGTEHAHDR